MSFPRLRDLLGAPVDTASFEQVLNLVTSATSEHFDLDFKRSHYARKAAEGADLATDIAALANSLGGVIILGIREENGLAVEATPVEFSEPEELWMQQKVANLIFPKPTWRLRRVADPADPKRGFCLDAEERFSSRGSRDGAKCALCGDAKRSGACRCETRPRGDEEAALERRDVEGWSRKRHCVAGKAVVEDLVGGGMFPPLRR